MKQRMLGGVLVAVLVAVSVAAVRGQVTPSITLDQVNPKIGDTVTFSYVLPAGVPDVCLKANGDYFDKFCGQIAVQCYQNVPFDFVNEQGITETHTAPTVFFWYREAKDNHVLLGGRNVWGFHNGPATCTATLWKRQGKYNTSDTWLVYAQIVFAVAGNTDYYPTF